MTEFVLFIIVGALAVAAAVMMLLSENAVYSALFLIVTMACIAFLFLLLDAPFLAMIQITVYAGAIMVLFIFVIMLLGAERLGAAPGKYRWMTGAAALLSAVFLLVAGVSITNGGVDAQRRPPAAPQIRVINALTDVGAITVMADDRTIASNLDFRKASAFTSVAPGAVKLTISGAEGPASIRNIDLKDDEVATLVIFGSQGNVTPVVVPTNTTTPPRDSARVTFVNAFMPTVDLVDLGPNGTLDRLTDRVILSDFALGQPSEELTFNADRVNWAFVGPDGQISYRMRDLELERGTAQLIVLSGEKVTVSDTIRPVAEPPFVIDAAPSFGGPEAIGLRLFSGYLLPFELVSLLLLASMIGAIVLTHREDARVKDRSARRRKVSRPLTSVIASQVGHEVLKPEGDPPPMLPSEGSSQPAGD